MKKFGIRSSIQKVSLYVYIILFIVGVLNYALPYIIDNNQAYNALMIATYDETFDVSTLEAVVSVNDIEVQSYLSNLNTYEVVDYLMQMEVMQMMVIVIGSLLYISFILMALVMVIQFISRRSIKFKVAFKYATLSLLVGSLGVVGMTWLLTISNIVMSIIGIVGASCLYSWLCYGELKTAMTKDYLGEEHAGYGVY